MQAILRVEQGVEELRPDDDLLSNPGRREMVDGDGPDRRVHGIGYRSPCRTRLIGELERVVAGPLGHQVVLQPGVRLGPRRKRFIV